MNLLRWALLALLLTPPALAEAPLLVEVVKATSTADTISISQTGEIVARDTLGASFSIGGRVASVEVERGDLVSAGDVLAQMESVQQEQALRAALAVVSSANADYLQAQDDYKRQDTLLARGATTRSARDQADDALRIAEGKLAQAQSELDRAEKALADTILLAPSDATVTDRMIEAGLVVGAAQPVLELALGRELDAVFEISEDLLTQGDDVTDILLTTIDPPIVRFFGQIREISPLVNPRTGTVTVKVGVTSLPEGVDYGEAVRGTAALVQEPHIALPQSAMSATAQGPAVWVVDPETMQVSVQPIVVDRFETERIILKDGLDEGTLVVSQGAQLLYPGRTVRTVGSPK